MHRLTAFSVFIGICTFVGSTSATLIWTEQFPYADGSLTSVSSGNWSAFSGADGSVTINSQTANLGSGGEDVRRTFTEETGEIYFGFNLNVQDTATSSDYAFGFRDGGTQDGGRFWLDGVTGGYNIGVSVDDTNDSFNSTPTLLLANATYRIVGWFNGSDTVAVWVDPGAADLNNFEVTATRVGATSDPDSFYFRQGGGWDNGASAWTADDLVIATTFGEVIMIPEPSTFACFVLALGVLLGARSRRSS